MTAFDPQTLEADLAEVRRTLHTFFANCSKEDWDRHTERGNQGWTLRETVAHLDAIALAYEYVIEAALAGDQISIPGLAQRKDLPTWNQREIAARTHPGYQRRLRLSL